MDKEHSPYNELAKYLPKFNFDLLRKINHAVKEILDTEDDDVREFLCGRQIHNYHQIYDSAVNYVWSHENSGELQVEVLVNVHDPYEHSTECLNVSIPFKYLTNRQAVLDAKAAEEEKYQKEKEERERRQYLELQKKYGGKQ